MREKLKNLQLERAELLRIRKKLPKGKIAIYRDGNVVRWYRTTIDSNGKKHREYLPKKNQRLATQLAKARVIEAKIEDCEQEIDAVESYLSRHRATISRADELLSENSDLKILVDEYDEREPDENSLWMNAKYEKLEWRENEKIYKAVTGEFMRSKNEMSVANLLAECEVAFRYEAKFVCSNGKVMYPDFIIRHPRTGRIFIWEIFGMMDNEEYRYKNLKKITDYGMSGFLVTDNLIITIEEDGKPFDSEYIMSIIRNTFLR